MRRLALAYNTPGCIFLRTEFASIVTEVQCCLPGIDRFQDGIEQCIFAWFCARKEDSLAPRNSLYCLHVRPVPSTPSPNHNCSVHNRRPRTSLLVFCNGAPESETIYLSSPGSKIMFISRHGGWNTLSTSLLSPTVMLSSVELYLMVNDEILGCSAIPSSSNQV